MRLELDVYATPTSPLPASFLQGIVSETFALSGCDFLFQKEVVSVSLAFVSEKEIRRLNREYRQKNSVTDILSFPEYADRKAMAASIDSNFFLGELVMCYDYIRRAAKEDGVSLERETAYILSHGVLHLLDFRHGERMFSLQDVVSDRLALK